MKNRISIVAALAIIGTFGACGVEMGEEIERIEQASTYNNRSYGYQKSNYHLEIDLDGFAEASRTAVNVEQSATSGAPAPVGTTSDLMLGLILLKSDVTPAISVWLASSGRKSGSVIMFASDGTTERFPFSDARVVGTDALRMTLLVTLANRSGSRGVRDSWPSGR